MMQPPQPGDPSYLVYAEERDAILSVRPLLCCSLP